MFKTFYSFTQLIKFSCFLAVCCLSIWSCKNKPTAKEDFDKYHKKRPLSPTIKSIKTYASTADSTHIKPAESLAQAEEYDSKGQKIKLTHYIGDSGAIDYITTYQYDDKGNAIQTHSVFPFDHSESTEKNTYDNKNHVIKTEWTKSDGNYGTHEYKFDSHGAMIQWDSYEKGHFMVTRLYPMIYDKDDHLIESFAKETHGSKDTMVQGHEKYSYDSVNNLEAAKMVLYGDAVLEIVESQYDTSRNKILEIYYERDTSGKLKRNTRIMNVYNEYGEITSSTTFKDGKVQSVTENKYDNYGHLIESSITEGGAIKKTRNVYEFYKQ